MSGKTEEAVRLMDSIELNTCTDGSYVAYARVGEDYTLIEGKGATVEESVGNLIVVYWEEIEKDA